MRNSRLLSLLVLLLFSFLTPLFAAQIQISGRVTDQFNHPVNNATVEAINPETALTVTLSSTGTDGRYMLILEAAVYDLRVSPPSASGFSQSTTWGRSITGDTVIDFILMPSGTALIRGRLLDGAGVAITNVALNLQPDWGDADDQCHR